MSQFDFGTINAITKSGTALAADLVSWRDALHSSHRGNTAPTYAAAGMLWVDDALDPIWLLKQYDGTNWIILQAVDTTNNVAWSVNLGERLRYPVAGGTANALTLTPAVAITAYLDTDVLTLEAAAANTAAATLNVSGVGAKAIRKIVAGADVAVVAGDILAGGRYTLNYKASAAAGAGAWVLVNPSASAISFGSSNAASATDLTKHIALFSTTHGFSVTANRLNYVAPTGVDHLFVVNGVDAAKIGGSGVVVGSPAGGSPGAGKVNAVEIQQNGVALAAARYVARAWVNFNGSGTVAIRDSYNVTSITDNNVGDWTVNFATAMANANYCAVGAVSALGGRAPVLMIPGGVGGGGGTGDPTAPTTTALRVNVYSAVNTGFVDPTYLNVAVFGG